MQKINNGGYKNDNVICESEMENKFRMNLNETTRSLYFSKLINQNGIKASFLLSEIFCHFENRKFINRFNIINCDITTNSSCNSTLFIIFIILNLIQYHSYIAINISINHQKLESEFWIYS